MSRPTTVSALPPSPSFGGSLEWRWDRFDFDVNDFYVASASTSVASSTALVPEPGTAVLLLGGLCALAARRRLR